VLQEHLELQELPELTERLDPLVLLV